MLELRWQIAEVIDNDEANAPVDVTNRDTKTNKPRLGRVQIKFIPGHSEVDVSDANQKACLPWARPFMHTFPTSFNPPKIGSKVWCVSLDEYYKNIFYLNNVIFNVDVPLDELLKKDFKTFPSEKEKLDIKFPQFRFYKLPNDSVFFLDTETKELGIWHSAGAFIMFGSDGTLIIRTNGAVDIKSAEKISIESSADIIVKSGTKIPMSAAGVYLGSLIADLVSVVEKTIDGANYISPVGPCSSPLMALKPTLTQITIDAEKFKE